MPDMQKLRDNKEKIISIIQSQGPSFPARISRAIGISPLFTSAFLAELVSEKRLKISNMKVGSSPVYFIEGQEEKLEQFKDNLNPKQREAFELLKISQVLSDDQQAPAIRVALRSLKDFAHPITVRINPETTKLFWKFSSLQEAQAKSKISELLSQKPKSAPQTPQAPKQTILTPQTPPPQSTPITQQTQPPQTQTTKPQITQKETPFINQTLITNSVDGGDYNQKPKKKAISSEFANSIREYLEAKDIEILETLSEKKREFISRIRLDETFGKQEFYAIAKDKKRVSTNDLTIALQQAQTEKMPAIFISPGELDKKAKEHLKTWKNLIKFEKVNF